MNYYERLIIMNKLRSQVPYKKIDYEIRHLNADLKKILQNDFTYNCAYCNDRDTYAGGFDNYHIEHFAPRSKFAEYEFKFSNLFYSCPYCNRAKSNKWITNDPLISFNDNKGFVNPCTDEYDNHLARNDYGSIIYKTDLGRYMYVELKLYLKRHQVNFLLDKIIKQRHILKEMKERSSITKEKKELLEKIINKLNEIFVDTFTSENYKELELN